jgi:methionine-rich copper-binding protein CopC
MLDGLAVCRRVRSFPVKFRRSPLNGDEAASVQPEVKVLKAAMVGAATGVMIMLAAAPASAHAELESITPGQKSVQTAPPREVRLTFDEPVNRRFTVIKVTGPAGAAVASGVPTVDREVVRQPLVPLSQPGRYQVAYRTVSVDGHIVSGSREFTFRPDPASTTRASGQAAPPAPPVTAAAPQQDPSSERFGIQLALGGVAVALLAGVALTIRRARHRDG